MEKPASNEEKEEIKAPQTGLPFEGRKGDWVDRVYEHRAGILATVIVYLILGISFVTARIVIVGTQPHENLYIDLSQQEEEQLITEEELREIQLFEQLMREMEGYNDVSNVSSDANAQLNAALRDAKGTQASEIYDEARALEDRLSASRAAYEDGLRSAEDILNNRPSAESTTQNGDTQTSKAEGSVTVEYSLDGRQATYLHVPAYQCRGGGTITINIVVNRNGAVIANSVARGSSSDPCLVEMATKAASMSRFNVSSDAPERQQGTIKYIFVPQ